MHWNVSNGPEKWHIFGRFLTLFPLKRPKRREKNASNMAATVSDVMDDVTCKYSIIFKLISKSNGSILHLTTLVSFWFMELV
jgi:hypothetical protein